MLDASLEQVFDLAQGRRLPGRESEFGVDRLIHR